MKLSRKQKFDQGLSILENLTQQREKQDNKQHRRYILQQAYKFIRAIALLALAYWGYTTRHTIHAFIVEFFTNPKLLQ